MAWYLVKHKGNFIFFTLPVILYKCYALNCIN